MDQPQAIEREEDFELPESQEAAESSATLGQVEADRVESIEQAPGASRCLGRIPQSQYVITSTHEGHTRGVLVGWVQQVSFEPAMVMVSLLKGREIVPLIHGSHAFALSQLTVEDRLSRKIFSYEGITDEDAMQGLSYLYKETGSPIIAKSHCYMDCELVRHVDIDGDHDLYVGLIRKADVLREAEVAIRVREDGMKY